MTSYILDTVNMMSMGAIGAKVINLDNKDVCSCALFIGIASMIHSISMDLLGNYFSKKEKKKDSSEKLFDPPPKIYDYAHIFKTQLDLPILLASAGIAFKITELFFKSVSFEPIKNILLFLSLVKVISLRNF